jgi:AAA domain
MGDVDGTNSIGFGPDVDDTDDDRYNDLYLPRSALADLPRGEPLIDGVLDRHTLFVIAGRDHTYKSFLVVSWLCSLATGFPWLGRDVERTKVLYVVGEGAWGLHARITAWETAWGEQVDDKWFTVRRAPVNLFRYGAPFADLLARSEADEYGVVVFDTLQRNVSGADQNSARDAGVIVESLDLVRQATGGSTGIVAHTDKGDHDTRGSSAFEDDADIVWRCRRDEDEQTIRATMTKHKDGPEGLTLELRPRLIGGTGSLILEQATPLPITDRRPPAQALPVLRLLANGSVPTKGLSATPIADALGVRGRGPLYRSLDWLMEAGYVLKVELGQYPTYKITDEGVSQLAHTAADQG